MWRTFCLLSLTLFTFDFPRDRLPAAAAAAEPIRPNPEIVIRDDRPSYRKENRDRSDGRETSAELVGKWRNNGEALEPKWRDGDTVPLIPFSQLSRYTEDKIENGEVEEGDHQDRYGAKYGRRNGREGSPRSLKNNPRPPSHRNYQNYESIESRRGFRTREEVLQRKRNRLWAGENGATFRELGNRTEELDRDGNKDNETPSARYREAFQGVRPNDYEHEFNDDEYLKPRPRKRRPPQNYEFALVKNDTSLNVGGRTENDPEPWPRASNPENSQGSAFKDGQFARNATQLKSLLKMQQEEGLSLSEILQLRNLTLSDLLRGKADVINALRTKNIDETEDYAEEDTARMMSNSFTGLSTTRNPQRFLAIEPVEAKNSQKDEEPIVSIAPAASATLRNDHTNEGGSSSGVSDGETYSEAGNATGGISIPSASVDPTRDRVVITTSMPLPVATNSMELLQADYAVVKSQNSGETKAESLDEDEIMEFSDFTDYKKGRNGMSPVWLMMKNDRLNESPVESSRDHFDDTGSTLSIEKILSSTERSKSAKNLSTNLRNGQQQFYANKINFTKGEILRDDGERVTAEHFVEGNYSISFEKEYQNDAPMIHYDLEHSTQASSSIDRNNMNRTIAQESESDFDEMFHDVNGTLSNNLRMEKNDNNTLEHRQDMRKSYDDIISEVEPEARAEIFELFASGSAGKRLERLLKSRNMSVEELIALRQRGSSKVHLAEVSRIKVQKSNDTNNVKATISLLPKHDHDGERAIAKNYEKKINNYLLRSTQNTESSDSFLSSTNPVYYEATTTGRLLSTLGPAVNDEDAQLDVLTKINDEKENITERHHTVQIVDLLTTFASLPFIKDIQGDFVGRYDSEDKRKLPAKNSNPDVMFMNKDAETVRTNDTSNVIESGFVKEIVRQEPSSIDIQTVYSETRDVLREDESRSAKGKTLSKVKPSIIASGAVLGLTLVVFLAIFIICRIRQKQRYRYRNTFPRAVFQGPVTTARKLSNSSSLSTVMVNVVATSTTKRPEKVEAVAKIESKSDIDNDSLDANDSWETIPDYMK